MDYAACYVVYVDRTACEDRLYTKEDSPLSLASYLESTSIDGEKSTKKSNRALLHDNIATLLSTFGGGKQSEIKPRKRWDENANLRQYTYAPLAQPQ